MSFGSENPELWNEICKRGVVSKLRSQMEKEGFDFLRTDNLEETLVEAVVATLYEIPKVQKALIDWANSEICNEEIDYHGSQIDEAVMRYETYHKW